MKKIALCFMSVIALGLVTTANASTGPAAHVDSAYACTHNPNSSVRMRAGAGTNFRVVAGIPNRSRVTIHDSRVGTDGEVWYKITYRRTAGWARYDYICTN